MNLWQGGRKGNIFVAKPKKPQQTVSRGERKCCLTHVGLICDRPGVQAVLPQVVIGNWHAFHVNGPRGLAALKAASPPNVHLLMQKSAWNNVDTLIHIIGLLGAALGPHPREVQPILFLDACRLHLNIRVIDACHVAHIWPIVIPAQMTWLLQPLDTHAFFLYKLMLKEAYQTAQAKTEDGKVAITDFMACLYEVIRRVLQGRDWSTAFGEVGFGPDPEQCRACVRKALGVEGLIAVPGWWPTDEQIKLCFPHNAKISIDAFFRPFFSGPALPPPALAAQPADRLHAAFAASAPLIFGGRTRGDKRKADEAAASHAAASAPSGLRPRAAPPRAVRPHAVTPRGATISFYKGIPKA